MSYMKQDEADIIALSHGTRALLQRREQVPHLAGGPAGGGVQVQQAQQVVHEGVPMCALRSCICLCAPLRSQGMSAEGPARVCRLQTAG